MSCAHSVTMLHMNYLSRLWVRMWSYDVYAYVHECVTVQLSVLDAVTYTTLVAFSAPVALVVRCVYCEQPHITILNIVHSLHT